MKIYINAIGSGSGNDLENINGLNHYIGMKRIEPEAIPELKIMPYIIGALIGFGLLVAAVGRRSLAWTWVAMFIAIGIVGMWDFYQWEYDYGHNLNPHAAIKIEGMSYQPPLIGSKQLLNFTAHSYPDIGGWIVGGAILLGACAAIMKRNTPKIEKKKMTNKSNPSYAVLEEAVL